jgi:hypothetical protein
VLGDVDAEQRRERGVPLVPVEGPGLLAVPLVPVPGLPVRLRRRARHRPPAAARIWPETAGGPGGVRSWEEERVLRERLEDSGSAVLNGPGGKTSFFRNWIEIAARPTQEPATARPREHRRRVHGCPRRRTPDRPPRRRPNVLLPLVRIGSGRFAASNDGTARASKGTEKHAARRPRTKSAATC